MDNDDDNDNDQNGNFSRCCCWYDFVVVVVRLHSSSLSSLMIIVNRIQWRCWIWKNEQTRNQWPKWYIVFFFGDWKNRFSSMMMMILMMMMVFYSRNKKLIGVKKKWSFFPEQSEKKILFFQSRTWTVFLNEKKIWKFWNFRPTKNIYVSARQSLIKFSLSLCLCVCVWCKWYFGQWKLMMNTIEPKERVRERERVRKEKIKHTLYL